MASLEQLDGFTWHPTNAEKEEESFFRATAVYSTFRNMKSKQLKKFHDKYLTEVTVALTKYFLENYDEYTDLFEPLQYKAVDHVID